MEQFEFADDKQEIDHLRKRYAYSDFVIVQFHLETNLIFIVFDPPCFRVQEMQFELEEYQESSRELEAELEAQLNSSEKRNSELKSVNSRLQSENESLKSKLNTLSIQSQQRIFELEKQLNDTQVSNAKLSRCIRELEQSNDDLERAKRALHASLDDFERKLNHQIEKNVLLENELGEKEQLEVSIQRLKDETRDLKQELTVRQQQPLVRSSNSESFNLNPLGNGLQSRSSVDRIRSESFDHSIGKSNGVSPLMCNGSAKKMMDDTTVGLNTNATNTTNGATNESVLPNPMFSPSTRISVLNIVSDLLRKVGALESKLASCKTIDAGTGVPGSPAKSSRAFTSRLSTVSTGSAGQEISNNQMDS